MAGSHLAMTTGINISRRVTSSKRLYKLKRFITQRPTEKPIRSYKASPIPITSSHPTFTMAHRIREAFDNFLNSIPDNMLSVTFMRNNTGTIRKDGNFRLDMQNVSPFATAPSIPSCSTFSAAD